MNRQSIFVAVLAALVLSACGSLHDKHHSAAAHGMSPAAPAAVRDGVLASPEGMTLYTFDRDPGDATKSACNGPCAANWPPFRTEAGSRPAGDWKLVARDDGSSQWAYKGKPLYLWVKDTQPGDRTGDGFNGVWRIARP